MRASQAVDGFQCGSRPAVAPTTRCSCPRQRPRSRASIELLGKIVGLPHVVQLIAAQWKNGSPYNPSVSTVRATIASSIGFCGVGILGPSVPRALARDRLASSSGVRHELGAVDADRVPAPRAFVLVMPFPRADAEPYRKRTAARHRGSSGRAFATPGSSSCASASQPRSCSLPFLLISPCPSGPHPLRHRGRVPVGGREPRGGCTSLLMPRQSYRRARASYVEMCALAATPTPQTPPIGWGLGPGCVNLLRERQAAGRRRR